jgi:hypothetical protein
MPSYWPDKPHKPACLKRRNAFFGRKETVLVPIAFVRVQATLNYFLRTRGQMAASALPMNGIRIVATGGTLYQQALGRTHIYLVVVVLFLLTSQVVVGGAQARNGRPAGLYIKQ